MHRSHINEKIFKILKGLVFKPYEVFILFFIVGFVFYGITLNGEFVFDDYAVISEASRLHFSFSNLLLGQRFFSYLTFTLNHVLFGSSPFSYHLVNICIHITNSYLVFLILRITLKTTQYKKSHYLGFLSFFGGLFFLLHPIQTQAVSYIAQRMTSLATLFCFLTLFLYAQYRLAKKKSFLLFLISLTSFLVALSKETSLILPLALVLYDQFFLSRNFKKILKSPIWILPLLIIWGRFLGPIVYESLTAQVELGQVINEASSATFEFSPITRQNYILTQLQVIPRYIFLLFLPLGLRLDYDFPLATSFVKWPTPFYFLLLFGILLSSLLLRKRFSLISFGIILFFLALLPSSTIFPIADVIFEHRVYLAFFGVVFIFVEILGQLFLVSAKNKMALFGLSLMTIWCLFLAIITLQRNFLWSDKLKFWQDNYQKAPNKARVMKNYGVELVKNGQLEKGLDLINAALVKEPDQAEYYLALAKIYYINQEYEKAEQQYLEVVKRCQRVSEKTSNYFALAITQLQLEKTTEAIKNFNYIVSLDKDYYPAYLGLCTAYEFKKDYRMAIQFCEKALDLRNNLRTTHLKLSALYKMTGNYPLADYHLFQAQKVDKLETDDNDWVP